MERQWHIIPEYENIEKSLELAKKYNAVFEYNDFFKPDVFENEEILNERINFYKGLDRDRSKDTLHGIFLDLCIASMDTTIREYSKKRIAQSMEIADKLGVKGVVFHTGLIGGLTVDYYINGWVNAAAELFTNLAKSYPHIMIYLENSFEFSPDTFLKLMDKVKDDKNTDEAWLERIALTDAINRLSEREQRILELRFFQGKTQMEVSSEIGISQAQVSRLEKNAIASLRKSFSVS